MTRLKKASPRPRRVPPKEAVPPPEAEPRPAEEEAPTAEEEARPTDEGARPAEEEAPTAEEEAPDAGEPSGATAEPPPPPPEEVSRDEVPFEEEAETQSNLPLEIEPARLLPRVHLRGLLEALVFASDKPVTSHELAKLASAPLKEVKEILGELRETYAPRGITLGEVAGGWLFRTSAQFAPFVRELTGEKPVRLSRAQLETLAIAAYRQPITRPEIDEIRGVDSGATMKLLLERDLLRILGKKDEPGRPLLYGTTTQFLEFFGLKSLKELPTLREFAELSDESRAIAEAELGDVLPEAAPAGKPSAPEAPEAATALTEETATAPAEEAPAEETPAEEAGPGPTEEAGGSPFTDHRATPDDATLADVEARETGDNASDEAALADVRGRSSGARGDDAAPADVDDGSSVDDTAITDPGRISGEDD